MSQSRNEPLAEEEASVSPPTSSLLGVTPPSAQTSSAKSLAGNSIHGPCFVALGTSPEELILRSSTTAATTATGGGGQPPAFPAELPPPPRDGPGSDAPSVETATVEMVISSSPTGSTQGGDRRVEAGNKDYDGHAKEDEPPRTSANILPLDYNAIPWDQRKPDDVDSRMEHCQMCSMSPHLLRRFEFILRFTILSILPASIIAYHEGPGYNWEAPLFVVILALVVPQFRVGATVNSAGQCLRGMIFYLVLIEICIACGLQNHWAAWYVVFAFVCLLVGFTTSGLTTKITLYYFCGSMVLLWNNKLVLSGSPTNQEYIFPLQVYLLPSLVGLALALVVPLLPFPRLNATQADEHLAAVFSSLSICFAGVCDSVYIVLPGADDNNKLRSGGTPTTDAGGVVASTSSQPASPNQMKRTTSSVGLAAAITPDPEGAHAEAAGSRLAAIQSSFTALSSRNTKRQVNLARIRAVRHSINYHLADLGNSIELASMEPIPADRLAKMKQRRALAVRLLASLDTMISFVYRLADDPSALEDADKATEWLEHVSPALSQSGPFVDHVCRVLSSSKKVYGTEDRAELDKVNQFIHESYDKARSIAVYEEGNNWTESEDAEKHFPLSFLSFFMFNFGTFVATLAKYNADRAECAENDPSWLKRFLLHPLTLVQGLKNDFVNLYHGKDETISKLIEAAKLSFAMTTAVAFLSWLGVQDPAGGAAVIAFAKGADPSSNVISNFMYVMATVLGSVAGFLLASVSQNVEQTILYGCVCALVFGFMREGDRFTQLGFLGTFFSLAALAPDNGTLERLVTIIQQNVAAVAWLGLTHLVLFPNWPSIQLQKEFQSSISCFRTTVIDLCQKLHRGEVDLSSVVKSIEGPLQSSIAHQQALLNSVAGEPTVKKLPFPTVQARRVITALEHAHAALTPAAIAVQFSMRFRDKEMALDPSQRTHAWSVVIEGVQRHIPRILHHFDALCRAIEACCATADLSADLVPSLLQSHNDLSACVQGMSKAITTAFFYELNKKPRSVLFQAPAATAVMHFLTTLQPLLQSLVLAVVEFRRLQLLRT